MPSHYGNPDRPVIDPNIQLEREVLVFAWTLCSEKYFAVLWVHCVRWIRWIRWCQETLNIYVCSLCGSLHN